MANVRTSFPMATAVKIILFVLKSMILKEAFHNKFQKLAL